MTKKSIDIPGLEERMARSRRRFAWCLRWQAFKDWLRLLINR